MQNNIPTPLIELEYYYFISSVRIAAQITSMIVILVSFQVCFHLSYHQLELQLDPMASGCFSIPNHKNV